MAALLGAMATSLVLVALVVRLRGRAKGGEAEAVSRESSLSWSEFRTLYTGLGGVMFVAGLGLAANWVSTVYVSPASRHLQIAGPLFYFGLVLVGLAFYAFVAAMSDSKYLWLPRKGAVLQGEVNRRFREGLKQFATATLSQAHLVGVQLQRYEALDVETGSEWQSKVQGLISGVWGPQFASTVAFGGRNPDPFAHTQHESVREMALELYLRPTMANLNGFIAIVRDVPVVDGALLSDVVQLSSFFGEKMREITEEIDKETAVRLQAFTAESKSISTPQSPADKSTVDPSPAP